MQGELAALLVISATSTLDAEVETSVGKRVRLAKLWDKPTVLFYEDRESTGLNQHVKDALTKAGRERGLLLSINVVAVANVAAWDWFPAKQHVLKAVRDVELKAKLPVYLDFRGALSRAPWSLPAKGSTVVVVSASGQRVMQLEGQISEEKLRELFSVLQVLVAANDGGEARVP